MTPKRPRLDQLVPMALILGLVVLQVQQGVARIGTLRERDRVQFLTAVRRMNAETSAALRWHLTGALEDVQVFTRLPLVRQALESGDPAVLAQARQLLAMICDATPGCRTITLAPVDVGDGAGAGDLDGSPGRGKRLQADTGTRFPQPRVMVQSARVEGDDGRLLGTVVVTRDSATYLEVVRAFLPIEGLANALVDPDGLVLAADANASAAGLDEGMNLSDRFPEAVAKKILAGEPRVRAGGARLFVRDVGDEGGSLFLVSAVPDSALALKARPVDREAYAVAGVILLSTTLAAAAAFLFHRSELRERALRARQRELEREREVSAHLARTERLSALGLLTAGVAHEVNNPLEGIGNYLALLEEADLPDERRRHYLERVGHGVDRIRSIVRDLLGFARPGGGRGPVDLSRVAANACDLARLASGMRGCTLTLDQEGPAPTIVGDARGLEQVLLNLLLNAGNALNGKGHIRVLLRSDARSAEILVEDEGPGIAPADIERIFDPFFTSTGGTGLGLSISYGIVQAHGGTIEAENRAEGGARFTVTLPLDAPEEQEG